jgi:hypothetical protein
MSLLRQLRDATIATEQPLTAVLRRAIVLADQLESPLLHQWARRELSGYTKGAGLPAYRRSRPVVVRGDFIVYGQPEITEYWSGFDVRDSPETPLRETIVHIPIEAQLKDIPIAPDQVVPSDRHRLFEHELLEPVQVYEDWLSTKTSDLRIPWPQKLLARYSSELRKGAKCQDAWQMVSRKVLLDVVGGVRNGLLEFALKLEREAPTTENGELTEFGVDQGRVTQIFAKTIYAGVTMEQPINIDRSTIGNVAGGRNNAIQQGDVTQQGVDLGALIGTLRAAVEQLDGRLPAEQLDATRGLVKDLEEDAAEPQPAPDRIHRKLKAIAEFARTAGPAGAAVIDAAQAIQRALGS